MRADLLICAAIDFSGGKRLVDKEQALVGSLKLGLAGDIRQGSIGSAYFATRQDSLPWASNPRVSRHDFSINRERPITLLAGSILEPEQLCRRLAISLPSSHADLYAAAFAAFGEQCDTEVIGHYAVIQYFPRSNRARMARSPLGAPPLHVWRQGSVLAAASLPRSLFAIGARPELDPERMADVALLNFEDARASYYKDLSRVPCGWVEHHSPDAHRSQSFWSLDELPPSDISTPEEAISSTREQLDRAVRAHAQPREKPAIMLSGGLDSQAVASSYLRGHTEAGGRLRSYTSVPIAAWHGDPDTRLCTDESEAVAELAALYPALDASFVEARQDRFAADLDSLIAIGSWPSFNEMNMHWVHAIYRQARADGFDTLFTGDYGDPGLSFDGSTLIPGLLRNLQLGRLKRELEAIDDSRSLPRKVVSLGLLPLLPQSIRRVLDRLRGYTMSPFSSWSPLDHRRAANLPAMARARASRLCGWSYRPSGSHATRALMLAPGLSEGPEIDLAMRLLHGVSTRDPLAFRPLFEHVSSLPDDLFLRNGTPRWLAREVLRGRVPDRVIEDRRVAVQSSDFFARLRDWGAEMIRSIAAVPQGSVARQILDLDRIARDLEDHRAETDARSYRWYRLASAAPRGLALARFAQLVERRNDGG